MDSENVNVTGDDFVTLGDIADKNSVAYSFWNFVKTSGDSIEDGEDNLYMVGKMLQDKFGEDFSMSELEAWINNQDNKPYEIIDSLKAVVYNDD